LVGESAYVLNIPTSNIFHHKGIIGSIFAVMFGYTVTAEWARVIVHLAYLVVALPLVIWVYRKRKRRNSKCSNAVLNCPIGTDCSFLLMIIPL
jgi:high-affinity iron transporter